MHTGCTAFGGMRAALAILGVGLLAACSGSSSSSGPSGGMPPDDGSGSMVADLGEWNSLEPGSLEHQRREWRAAGLSTMIPAMAMSWPPRRFSPKARDRPLGAACGRGRST